MAGASLDAITYCRNGGVLPKSERVVLNFLEINNQ
jgi:hypothetical protein